MKIKRITALLLVCTLGAATVLTGCGSKYDQDDTVATLDGKEIPLGLVNLMAQVTAVSYDSYLGSYYGSSMWETDMMGDGTTMSETVRESTISDVQTDYLLEAHMEDYGVELTEEDLANVDKYAAEFMEENSKEALKAMGAEEEYVKEMLRLYLIQTRMHDAIIAEVDTEVSDEEAAQRTFSYYTITEPEDDTEEAESTEAVEESTEEAAAELAALAEEVSAAAKTDFEGAAETYGYTVSTYSYGDDEDSFDETVIAAADALNEGEISDLIETADGEYYVIRLDSEFDEEATESKKDEIVSTRQSDHYTEVTDGYKEDSDWSVDEDMLASITFDKMYSIVTEESTETEAVQNTEAVDGTDSAEDAVDNTETAYTPDDTEAVLETTEQ